MCAFCQKDGRDGNHQRTIKEWCCSLASASPPWAQSAQTGHDGAWAVVAAEAVKGV